LFILDERGQPLPLGAVGELYIGGEGVAPGYVNDPARTAERFVSVPAIEDYSRTLVRTGDLARFDADGCVVLMGRVDRQLKIRGLRVPTEEIEEGLAAHPSIAEAYVYGEPKSADGPDLDVELVAYVRGASGRTLDPDELRGYLRNFV